MGRETKNEEVSNDVYECKGREFKRNNNRVVQTE
jgi:hypothetical protein